MRLLFISPPGGEPDPRSMVWPGLDHHADVDVLPLDREEDRLSKHGPGSELSSLLAIVRAAQAERYDYIVGHATAFLWLPIFRLAGVTTPFAIVPNYNHVNPYDIYALALATQFRRDGDLLFTGSRSSQAAFQRFGFRCFPYHTPGIPLERFRCSAEQRARVRSGLGIPGETPLLLYAGRLDRDKSVRSLLRAHHEIAKSVTAHMVISYHMGNPDYVADCRLLGAQLPRVTFVESPSHEDLLGLYNAADLFVLIGVSEYETFGRSPLEAMACGAVPVVPAYDGFFENIPETAGVLVPTYGDVAARRCSHRVFAGAVTELLARPARLQQMASAAREAVVPFDSALCVSRFCHVLASAGTPAAAEPRTRWSSARLPPELRVMTSALEGAALADLLADFIRERVARLDASADRLMQFRRAWFASFFPRLPQAA